MKKITIIMILFSALIIGCVKKIKLEINTPLNIVYEDFNFTNDEIEDIKNILNEKIFYPLYNFKSEGIKLMLYTNEDTYNFEILDNYIIYIENNKKYYAKSENIKGYLNDIKKDA